MKIKNPTIQKTIKVATIAGAAVIVVNSAMKLVGVSSPKEAVCTIVTRKRVNCFRIELSAR